MTKYFGIFLVKFYQKVISPYCHGCCRFDPTCSNYMLAALHKYGLLKGCYLGFKRLIRCHPWGGSGYEPL